MIMLGISPWIGATGRLLMEALPILFDGVIDTFMIQAEALRLIGVADIWWLATGTIPLIGVLSS